MRRPPFSDRPGRPRRPPSVMVAMLTVVVLAITTTACSSSSSPTTTSTAATSTSVTTSTTTASSSSTTPSSGSAGAAIDKAYMALFDLANPAIAPKLAAVQDGSSLRSAFVAALKSPLAQAAGGARVLSATIESKATCSSKSLPSPCALVTYDVLSPSGAPLLTNQKGFAVESSGHWLVSKMTICALLTLDNGGTAPAGC